MLETFVQELGRELDMEDLVTSSEAGHYIFPFEDEVLVEIWQNNQSYFFKSKIGPCPKENAEVFLVRVLDANLFGRGTRQAVIGLDSEGQQLLLSTEIDLSAPYKEFREKLGDFISVLDFWRKEALQHR